MKTIFEYKRPSGVILAEHYLDGRFFFKLKNGDEERELSMYSLDAECEEVRNVYLGHTKEEVLASGRDILGEKLLSNGDPEYSEVKKALPIITDNQFAFLGGPASWSGVTILPDGSVVHQASGRDRDPKPIFRPADVDPVLGALTPRQMLLGEEYPIFISLHTDGGKYLEFLYFVEPGDTDRDPITWIRIKRFDAASPENCSTEYRVAAINREGDEQLLYNNPPSEEIFLDALSDTVNYWVEYASLGARIDIPEVELSRVARGAMTFASLTFTGDHPHYGHRFYGKELHDNFPPNYIWAIEAAVAEGRLEWAKGIFGHFMNYALNGEGRISYRQGTGLNFGVSATEYGMLLAIAARYKRLLGLDNLSWQNARKLMGMGDEIISHIIPCPELGGLTLVKMCAEADTNERVNVYLNNNLWAIRGFMAIESIFEGSGFSTARYSEARRKLEENVAAAIEVYSEKDTRFGSLPPFRLGYTATPATLSICREPFFEMTEAELEGYFDCVQSRGQVDTEQDLRENTYSNYRYYPEMLCSMLLSKEHADNIVKMRESIGGELLGMTRFRGWIDNWPVLHYARFLIETGRVEKYLLLLFAHTAHHGRPDLMAYYEQIYLDGRVKADDSVPSLLTTPTMLAWAFAYERVSDGVLQLLSAIPRSWYSKPFSAKGIAYSGGAIDIDSDGEYLSVDFAEPTVKPCELILRAHTNIARDSVECGSEYVLEIRKNRIILKAGISKVKIKLK